MIWDGKPLTSGKKGWRAQGNRKSRDLGRETADQLEKRMVGSWWGKTADQCGLRVQSPIQALGEGPLLKKKDAMLETKNNLFQSECPSTE